jgi:hypothetical protein
MGWRERRVKLACQFRQKGKQMKKDDPQVTVAFRVPVKVMAEIDRQRDAHNRRFPDEKDLSRSDMFRSILTNWVQWVDKNV